MTDPFRDDPVVLEVRNLSVDYLLPNGTAARALHDVNFRLRRGEILGVVGESGCGKTTLMLSLMRLLPGNGRIVDGEIDLLGQDLLNLSEKQMAPVRWKHISMIFQGAMNALNPVRTVGSQIAEPIARHKMSTLVSLLPFSRPRPAAAPQAMARHGMPAFNPTRTVGSQIAESIVKHDDVKSRQELDARVAELLDLVGISPDRRHEYPHQYSGGMRQRAMIAMALACSPEVIIADEPTTALDVMVQAQILDLLQHLREELGLAVLFVTHDLGVVAEVCDSVLVMYGGVAAEYADVDTVYNRPVHPYTRLLLQAFPRLWQPVTRLTSIPGAPPQLDDLPPGCRFAPRCPLAFARCAAVQPPMIDVTDFHGAACFLAATEVDGSPGGRQTE